MSAHQVGVSLIFRNNSDNWGIESPRKHGPNMISAFMVYGKHRWLIIGTYLPPEAPVGTILMGIETATDRHSGQKIIGVDFNLRPKEGEARDIEIMATLRGIVTEHNLVEQFWTRKTQKVNDMDMNGWEIWDPILLYIRISENRVERPEALETEGHMHGSHHSVSAFTCYPRGITP